MKIWRTDQSRLIHLICHHRLVAVLLISLLSASCTTLTKIPDTSSKSLRENLETGDKIVVSTRDINSLTFTISEINSEAIKGEGNVIAIDEITKIQKKNMSVLKTVFLWNIIGTIILAQYVFY